MEHVHDFQPTKYDKFELRCSDPDCFTSKILPGNPRYCSVALEGIPHSPHEFRYWYYRYNETEKTTGSYWCHTY